MAIPRLCSIPDCGKRVHAMDFCGRHYMLWKRNGEPVNIATRKGAPLQYLVDVVMNHNGADCLFWPFGRGGHGYGEIHFRGRHRRVPNLVCELSNGVAPSEKHHAAHSCGNGHLGCCNKHHLSWKLPIENKADEVLHGTRNWGERAGGSKLSERQVTEIRSLRGVKKHDEIAAMFGVSPSTICNIHRRKSWRHIP